MTIKELVEKLDALTEEDRVTWIKKLYNLLSGVSKQTLINFQNGYNLDKPFEEFIADQNETIKSVLFLELSAIGVMVRKELGLIPLTEDTVL